MSPLNPTPVDDTRWVSRRYTISGTPSTPDEVTIHTLDCPPATHQDNEPTESKGTILLIHGYPQTSYQFRHVINPLSTAGYRVIAPDYRGAGHSSKPHNPTGYHKVTMAADLHTLVRDHLGIKEPVHVVGHDIGGMIAHAYAARFPEDTASVIWGECPLPGTGAYERGKNGAEVWHFTFHWQGDLPEALTVGRERLYIQHFYTRLSSTPTAITPSDTDHYASHFSQPGAMRSGFDLYRAFHADAADNRDWLHTKRKCKVPVCILNGEKSFLAGIAEEMVREMYDDDEEEEEEVAVVVKTVEGSGHWVAEENPGGFVRAVLEFVEHRE